MALKLKVKLLIDTSTNKVLFAASNKDFTDFLFTLLALPIGLVTELLTEERMVGSIGSLHKSLKDLPLDYMQNKNIYLKPNLPIPVSSQGMPLLRLLATTPDVNGTTPEPNSLFVSSQPPTLMKPSRPPEFMNPSSSSSGEGCVKGVVIYMVMDNLKVSPMSMDNLEVSLMSAISRMTLLEKFHVKDVGTLVEKVVEVGKNEGLALLKASLESKTVLTEVFGEKLKPSPI